MIRGLAGGLALVVGCAGSRVPVPGLVAWSPVDSINAGLPPEIRLYEGVSESLPLRAWLVSVDEGSAKVETRIAVAADPDDRRDSVSAFAARRGVCAAVNGGYFTMNRRPAEHVGLLRIDGHLLAPATSTVMRDSVVYPAARAAVGFGLDGRVTLGWAATRNDSVFLVTPPENRPGEPAASLGDPWTPWPVRDVVGAGPMLVRDGEITITVDQEVFFGSSIPDRHPRTAVGRSVDGRVLLLVVDGRQPASRGVDLPELARLMVDAGARDAMNLDGGGSSTLVVQGTLVNRPAGGTRQREVLSAITVRCN